MLMMTSARLRGESPRRSARPCSVTITITSCSVWSTWLAIGTIDEIAELGLDDAFDTAICVVEWAERMGSALPARRLGVQLDFLSGDQEGRSATIVPKGGGWDWVEAALAGMEHAA